MTHRVRGLLAASLDPWNSPFVFLLPSLGRAEAARSVNRSVYFVTAFQNQNSWELEARYGKGHQ